MRDTQPAGPTELDPAESRKAESADEAQPTSKRRDSGIPLPEGFRSSRRAGPGIHFPSVIPGAIQPPSSGADAAPDRGPEGERNVAASRGTAAKLLHERTEPPTPDSPIAYVERTYVIHEAPSEKALDQGLRAELSRIQAAHHDPQAALFVQLAFFDHAYARQPTAPPLATLSWKSWQTTADVRLHAAPRPATHAPTPKATSHGAAPLVLSADAEERLGRLFERFHELLYVSDADSAAQYVINALESHLRAAGALVWLSASLTPDGGRDGYVVVRAHGKAPERVLGSRQPSAGTLIAQAHQAGRTLAFDAPSDDPATRQLWTSLGTDGATGLCAPVACGPHRLGAVQLARAPGEPAFDAGEIIALDYVCAQFADFLVTLSPSSAQGQRS